MNKSKFFVVLLLCVSFIFVSASHSAAQEQNEIEKWIDDACVDTQKGAIFNYTYLVKVSYDRNKKWGFGRKFTRVYEAIVPAHFTLTKPYTHPLVLIEDSENRITQDAIMNARKDLVAELERAESVVDKPGEKIENVDGGYWTTQLRSNELRAKVDIFQIVKAAQFSNLKHKEVDGHSTISVDFSPKAGAKIDKVLDYSTQIEGQIWIDEETKRIIRVEGFYLGTFKDVRDKTDAEREDQSILLFLQTKVAEGFWFPKIVRLNFTKYPDIFESIKLEFRFSNYKKASVNIKDLLLKEPEQAKEKIADPTAKPDETGQPETQDNQLKGNH